MPERRRFRLQADEVIGIARQLAAAMGPEPDEATEMASDGAVALTQTGPRGSRWAPPLVGSDHPRQFGERRRDATMHALPYRFRSGRGGCSASTRDPDDGARRPIKFESTHRTQTRFQPTVIILDPSVRVLLVVVKREGAENPSQLCFLQSSDRVCSVSSASEPPVDDAPLDHRPVAMVYRDRRRSDAEILALRHQILVLQRQVNRPRFDTDRTMLAVLSTVLTRSRLGQVMLIVQPAAVIG